MLINLRNALMAGKRLPYDAEIEYLESTGTQYIDTGVLIDTSTDTVEITFMPHAETSGYQAYYGTDETGNGQFSLRKNTNGNNIQVLKNTAVSVGITADEKWHTVKVTPNKAIVDGVDISLTQADAQYTKSLMLFARTTTVDTITAYAKCRLASFKIYRNGTLVRDFIPVRKGTVGYLYDRVTRRLFGNAGTGDFICGPDVVPVEYIESHGTEWIDTGVTMTSALFDAAETTITFLPTGATSGTHNFFGDGSSWANGYTFGYTGNYNAQWSNGYRCTNIGGYPYSSTQPTTLVVTKSGAKTGDWASTGSGDSSRTSTGTLILFGCRRNGVYFTTTPFSGRIYSAKMIANGVPIFDFRSVRVGNGSTWEGAMMDVLTRRVYRNAGTGAFSYGNDLRYPIPAA